MDFLKPIVMPWLHIIFGLGVFVTAVVVGWSIYRKVMDRIDQKEIIMERLNRYSK